MDVVKLSSGNVCEMRLNVSGHVKVAGVLIMAC